MHRMLSCTACMGGLHRALSAPVHKDAVLLRLRNRLQATGLHGTRCGRQQKELRKKPGAVRIPIRICTAPGFCSLLFFVSCFLFFMLLFIVVFYSLLLFFA